MLDTMLASFSETPHDSASSWRQGPMGLAAAINHTTGESREQVQPHVSADGRVAAVFSGYLLNPDVLHSDLAAKGTPPANRSDVAIALAAYEAWGDACAERLLGEFSLIIADGRQGRLFVARDHLGFVPLYYMQDGAQLIIATDFRTLAGLSKTPLEPDRLYLAQAIANRWYTRDRTAWQQVKRVMRASVMRFDGKRLETHRYWEPPTDVSIRYKREEDYVEHYREVLLDCLKRVSRSDRSVGVAVSGGLDSSSLFCLADRLEQQGEWRAPGFAGYSLAAGEDGNAYELPYARAAASHVGRPLVEVPLFDPDIDWYTQDAAWHRDIPIPSNGAMMLDMERRVVEDGGRVLINGSGGDEWLQGNAQYYREFAHDADLVGMWQALRRDSADFGWGTALGRGARQALAELTPGPLRRAIRRRLRESRRRNAREFIWLTPEWRAALAEAEDAYDALLPENAVQWSKHNLVKSPFSDLTHSMMRRQRRRIGLESRHPMLSRAFIEFSLRTPAWIKRQGAMTKVVHRKAMAGVLPQMILDRKSKANFTNVKIDVQFAEYVRAHWREELGEICDPLGMEKVLAIDFAAPEGDYWAWEIWGLYAAAAFCISTNT